METVALKSSLSMSQSTSKKDTEIEEAKSTRMTTVMMAAIPSDWDNPGVSASPGKGRRRICCYCC
uniref:Putative disease resistance protein RGA3 n=1 Tax=Rhizophora mucronata TaxID=61149 RepID=A0A2P2LUT1_RHIMU